MAQGNIAVSGTGAGARPEEAASAYAGIEEGRLVVLAKPLPSGAAGNWTPFAVVRFQDLPEELRRQIAGASGHGAGATTGPGDPNAVPVVLAAHLRGEGDARYHAALPGDVVLLLLEEGHELCRQLPAGILVSGPDDDDDPTVKFFAGHGNTDAAVEESSVQRRIMQRLMKEQRGGGGGGKVVVLLLDTDNNHIAGPPAAVDWSSDGLAFFPREDALTLLGNGRATEQGIDVLLPPENVVPAAAAEPLRAPRPATYAVEVWVDAAAGGKAGDPMGVGVKAAGADAGHGHGGSLSPSAVLGIVVASSAATALAAGTVSPATAFGLFAALLGGLSLAMASVLAP